jgi:hypothetical protein
MIYLRLQPARMRLAARRATAGLAVANSKERNKAESLPHERSECFGYDRILAGPKGAPQISQCASPKAPTVGAVLEKDIPGPAPRAQRVQWVFPADCALPWPIWDALHPKISH